MSTVTRHASPVRWTPLELALGALVALMGVVVLVGWQFDIPALKSVVKGGVGMKANTALAFLLSGAALAMSSGRPGAALRRGATLLATVVALIAGLSLAEQLLSLDFGIDQLLFPDPQSDQRISQPGRMSPATAFCFMAIAASLTLAALRRPTNLQLPLAAALSASVTVIAAAILTGHVSHRLLGLRWGANPTMAVHTALAFLLLGIAGLRHARRLQGAPWALGRAATAGFMIGTLLMLGATELAASHARDMEANTAAVVRAQQSLRRLQEIRTDMRVMESAQRGHLIEGDERFVAAREATKTSVRERLAALRDSALADALPLSQRQALDKAIENRIAFGDRLVDIRRNGGFEAARAVFSTGEDVELTTRITEAMAPMLQLEQAVLTRRQAELKAATATTFLLLPVGSLLGLTVLLAVLFFLDLGFDTRRRAEQALSRSRAELRVVFESMSDGIRVIDQQRRLVEINPAGGSFHGLIEPAPTLDAMAAQVDMILPGGQVLTPEQWPGRRALRGDYVRNFEVCVRRRDTGRSIVVELTTAPLPGGPGDAPLVVLTSHDITERKMAEAAARTTQDRLELVVENMTEGLIILGLDGDRLHWNPAALTMLGVQRGSVLTKSRRELRQAYELSTLDGTVLPYDEWPTSRLMRGESLYGLELRVSSKDRAWTRVFSIGGARLHDASGNSLGFLTMTDVTVRADAEQQLQQLNAELEQRVAVRTAELQAKTRELESFCYSVSHDLKAPLRAIDGYSRLLFDEYGDGLDAEARLFIGNVRKATVQMSTLIDDLLAYSRQERRALVHGRIPLRALVEEKLARRASDLAGVQVSLDVDDVVVHADRESIEMALRNLIDNAVKFSARSEPPTLAIRARRVDGRCIVSVQDNGTGFDMRFHDKMFEIFQRLHRAEDYPGTGVGLALVRKAMERMGGRVWAQSQPGQGATFYLELELADDRQPADATA